MKQFCRLTLIICSLIFSLKSNATHFVGSDITYKCLDASGNYEVTLIIYRDCQLGTSVFCNVGCSAIAFCEQNIEVWGGDSGYTTTKFSTLICKGQSVRDIYPNPRCPNSKNTCDNLGCATPGSLSPGIERYEFKGIINIGASSAIPSNCCNIRFVFSGCCRNASIQNIYAQNYYSHAIVNRCLQTFPNCNSPTYSYDPYMVVCANQGVRWNAGAIDNDFDSLSYSLVPCLESYGVNSSYVPPYTALLPMPYSGPPTGTYPLGLSCNPSTGELTFKPQLAPFISIYTLEIAQWRKINNTPTMIGINRREIQTFIKTCDPNNTPIINSNPTSSSFYSPKSNLIACPGVPICFDIIARDTDVSDTTFLSWDKTMEKFGATFTPLYNPQTRNINGPRLDSFRFCWSPTSDMAKANPYNFTIFATDNKCPYSGKAIEPIGIIVQPGVLDVTTSYTTNCNSATLDHSLNTQSYSNRVWRISKSPGFLDTSNLIISNAKNFTATFQGPGKYPVQLVLTVNGTCGTTRIFYDTIKISSTINTGVSQDTTICSPQTFKIKLLKEDSLISKVRWYALPDVTNFIDTTTSFTRIHNITTDYVIVITDKNNCVYRDTCTVKVANIFASYSINNPSQCFKENYFVFTNTSFDSTHSNLNSMWKFSNGDTSKLGVVGKSFYTPGKYSFKLISFSNSGCSDSITGNFNVQVSPTALFSLLTDSIQCASNNLFKWQNLSTIPDDSLSFVWNFQNKGISNITNPIVKFDSSQTYKIILTAISKSNGCRDSMYNFVRVKQSPKSIFHIDGDSNQCLNSNKFIFLNQTFVIGDSLTSYWIFGNNTFSNLKNPSPIKYNSIGTFPVTLISTSSINSCKDTFFRTINVFANPFAGFTKDASLHCIGEAFTFSSTSTIPTGTFRLKWLTGDGNTYIDTTVLKHFYAALGQFTVQLIATSNYSCYDTATQLVSLNPRPLKPSIFGDTLAPKHSTRNYSTTANSGSTWTWSVYGDTLEVARQLPFTGNQATIVWGNTDTGIVAVVEKNSSNCVSDTNYLLVGLTPRTALNEIDALGDLRIYPQPATDKLYLSGRILSTILRIEIFTTEGKLIHQYNRDEIARGALPLHDISNGMYIMQVSNEREILGVRRISIVK